jgi:hypothetical protein
MFQIVFLKKSHSSFANLHFFNFVNVIYHSFIIQKIKEVEFVCVAFFFLLKKWLLFSDFYSFFILLLFQNEALD